MADLNESSIPSLDPMEIVTKYRSTFSKLERVRTPQERRDLESDAAILRDCWKKMKGEDTLHEMAFGEPWEDEQ